MILPVKKTPEVDLETLRWLVDGLPDGGALLGADLHVFHLNRPLIALLGLKPRDVREQLKRGMALFDLFDETAGGFRHVVEEALRTGTDYHVREAVLRSRAGEELVLEVSLRAAPGAAQTPLILLCVRDISGEVRVQQKYQRLVSAERDRAVELEKLVRARTDELLKALDEVTRLSKVDPLTGLLNRRAFSQAAEEGLAEALEDGRPLALLMCDLDHFKRVNDRFGHQAGDQVLQSVAAALLSSVRGRDRVGRFGGEEFILLLPESMKDHALQVAQRCRQLVSALPAAQLLPGSKAPLTLSLGIALFPQHGTTLRELVKNADHALYRAKREGRDRAILFDRDEAEAGWSDTAGAPKALVVAADEQRSQGYVSALAGHYSVTCARTVEEGLQRCRRIIFDVLLIEDRVGSQHGLDLLINTRAMLPEAFRVLIVEDQKAPWIEDGTAAASTDVVMPQREAESLLRSVVDGGLIHLRLTRERAVVRTKTITHVSNATNERLDALIAKASFDFALQPIFNLKSGVQVAVEALCRPRDPLFAKPETLFDAAAHSGRGWQLSRLVREKAVRLLAPLDPSVSMFVNLHPGDVSDPEFLKGEPALRPWAHRLVFEITERAAIPDFKRFQRHLIQLKELGYRIAVDDLGAGYANLNFIALLAPDFIKLDRLVVQSLGAVPRLGRLVRRVIEFSEETSTQVIAEGVEGEADAEFVKQLGCHLGQGYYYARPQLLSLRDPE